jgi:tetratricopeptide (TPR) repeat protein
MRRAGRHIIGGAILFGALVQPALAAAPVDWSGCAVPVFGADKRAVIAACTAVLNRLDLIDADRVRALAARGRTFDMAGDADAAIRDLDQAIKLAPADAELRVRRGWVAYGLRQFDEAMGFARRALALDPQHQSALTLLGAAAVNTRRFAIGKASLDKAVEIDPADVVARFERFEFFDRCCEQREALAELNDLLALQTPALDSQFNRMLDRDMSYRTMARLQRVKTLENMGRFPEALKAADAFVAAEPGAVSYGWRASYHLNRDKFDLAQADLEKALSYDADFWFLHHVQGRLYFYTHRYQDAVASLTRALARYSVNGDTYWMRALALRELHRATEAERDALTAVAVDRRFMFGKTDTLVKLGYLLPGPITGDASAPLRDAVRACMLDEGCW